MLFAAAVVSLTACGGSDSTTGTTSGGVGASFSASIGGVAWAAVNPLWLVTSGGVTMSAGDAGNATTVSLTFTATAPGTYTIGATLPANGIATVGKSNGQGWSTVAQGGTGTVTVTTLTTNHVVGTFSFDAVGGSSSGSATTVLHVTSGKFDFSK